MRIFGAFITLMSCAANASDISLMLSQAEQTALKVALENAQEEKQPHKPNVLRLDGIIYTNQDSWTIWLNGRPIKSGESFDDLRILKVTANSVEIIWSPKSDQHHQICLKPNEVFKTTKAHS